MINDFEKATYIIILCTDGICKYLLVLSRLLCRGRWSRLSETFGIAISIAAVWIDFSNPIPPNPPHLPTTSLYRRTHTIFYLEQL